MTDRPTLEHLLDAVRIHLETLVIPAVRAEPKLYFQTLVAVNVLKIAQREVAHGQAIGADEWASLNALTGGALEMPVDVQVAADALTVRNRALIADIRAGQYDEPEVSTRLAQHVEKMVGAQLALNAPALAQRLRAEDETGVHPA